MKFLNYLFVFTLTALVTQVAMADDTKKDFVKVYKKEFPVTAATTTKLDNRYGKIEVKTWNKNITAMTVRVTIKANDEAAANKYFERIKIYFTNGPDFVKGETRMSEPSTLDNMSEWIWGGNTCDFTINYEVYMPADGKLDSKNKYGDTNVSSLNGTANIDEKYGNANIENMGGQLNLSVAYGNGYITKAKTVNSNISYGELHVTEAKDMVINSAYSELNIQKADDIDIKSAYDDYQIQTARDIKLNAQYGNFKLENADNFTAHTQYTDISIKKLFNAGDFDMQYGGLNVFYLAKGFKNFNVVGSYTDVTVDIEEGASYQFDVRTSYADVSMPTAFRSNIDQARGSTRTIEGSVGSNSTKNNFKIRLSYGELVVR